MRLFTVAFFVYIIILFFESHFLNVFACTIDKNIVVVSKYIGEDSAGDADGGNGSAMFTEIGGMGVDSNGNLYVTDRSNCKLRRISRSNPSNPNSETYMGGPSCGAMASGLGKGTGTFSTLSDVISYKDGSNEYLYILEDESVRKIDITSPESPDMENTSGVTPFASGFVIATQGEVVRTGKYTDSSLPTGSLLITDFDHNRVLSVSSSGVTTPYSGRQWGFGSFRNGNPATNDPIDGSDPVGYIGIKGIAMHNESIAFITDYDNTMANIRILMSNGFIYSKPGKDHFLGHGPILMHCDGIDDEVVLKNPTKIVRDEEGFFVFIDEYTVKKLTLLPGDIGKVSTLAGNENSSPFTSGVSTDAILPTPVSLRIVGNTIFVACTTMIVAIDFVPPSQPSTLTLISSYTTNATIRFGNSQYDGGPNFQHYKYILKRIDTNTIVDTIIVTVDINATLEPYTFTNLVPAKNYEISQYGVNRVGDSVARTLTFETDMECYGISYKNTTTVCSGHGSCTSTDFCDCLSGYSGDNCNIYNCFGILMSDPNVCSGKGNCTATDTCSCLTGYSNSKCENYYCNLIHYSSSIVCNGHGSCIAPDQCSCSNGYGGQYCEHPSCFGIVSTDPTVCSGHGTCDSSDNCNCQSGYIISNCSLTLETSYEISPTTGELIVDEFKFKPLSSELMATSFTFYLIHPDSNLKIDFVTGSTSSSFYPPFSSSSVTIGAEINTAFGIANISKVVTVNELSDDKRNDKNSLLYDTTKSQNLENYFNRDCSKKSYYSNLVYLDTTTQLAYECSNSSFLVQTSDYVAYTSFEAKIVASETCSLDTLFKSYPSQRNSETLSMQSSILKCISKHTRNPSSILNHLQSNIQTEQSSRFELNSLTKFMETISFIIDYLLSPVGRSNRVSSELQSSAINSLLSAMIQKMESFIPNSNTFSNIISTPNFHVALAKNNLMGLTTSSSYSITSSKGDLEIEIPLGVVVPPSELDILSMRAILYEYDPFTWTLFSTSQNISSIIFSLQFFSSLSQTVPLQISEETTVKISLPGSYDLSLIQTEDTTRDMFNYKCLQWSNSLKKWEENGCTLLPEFSTSSKMVCECNKLDGLLSIGLRWSASQYVDPTDPDPKPEQPSTGGWIEKNWYVIVIALLFIFLLLLLVVCCIICCMICTCLCLRRKKKKKIDPLDDQFKSVYPNSVWEDVVVAEYTEEDIEFVNNDEEMNQKVTSNTVSGTTNSPVEDTPLAPNNQDDTNEEIPIQSFDEDASPMKPLEEIPFPTLNSLNTQSKINNINSLYDEEDKLDEFKLKTEPEIQTMKSDPNEIRLNSPTKKATYLGEVSKVDAQFKTDLDKSEKKKKKAGEGVKKKKSAGKKKDGDKKKVKKVIDQKKSKK